ncbi:hypothetical protein Tco_0626827 [Tanacetum coccineum]|uniref:Uncharacterized protein n=1 Tax=Tanacetum coccineum TaxID=301880 RepID=A0ABQ4WKQ3_9ASTR
MESLNSNSQEREMHQLQQMQDKAKEKCMNHSAYPPFNLKDPFNSRFLGFERACVVLLDQDYQTFTESCYLTWIQQFRDTLIQHMNSVKKSIDERAQHKRENNRRVNDRVMQSKEGKVDSSTTLDASLVVTESNETEIRKACFKQQIRERYTC